MTKPHSENVLNDLRDYWWSPDFVELMAKRWKLDQVTSMLDVGCGIGHWGQMITPHLSNDAKLYGIDPEESWVQKATLRAKEKGLNSKSHYQLGTAEAIPFPDNYFDMVTCQTVLVHVKEVAPALKEMLRVLKPGGLLAVAEPNNLVSRVVFNNLNFKDPMDSILDLIRFELICERGREHLGKGNANRGDVIPYYFHTAGIQDIQIYISDCADYFIPPYQTPRERLSLAGLHDENVDEDWEELEKEIKAFFAAGGGISSEFGKYWKAMTEYKNRLVEGYKNKTICASGGLMMYLVSGRKR